MDELKKLKVNLSCLIRLTKTELYDSIEDLKRNIEMIDDYYQKDPVKYEKYINQLKAINEIYIDSTISINNKLKEYYKELKDIGILVKNNNSNKIDKLQNNLELAITNLEHNNLKVKKYNSAIYNENINIISSETEYLINEVLRNYENLEQAKLEFYKEKNINILTKKYD